MVIIFSTSWIIPPSVSHPDNVSSQTRLSATFRLLFAAKHHHPNTLISSRRPLIMNPSWIFYLYILLVVPSSEAASSVETQGWTPEPGGRGTFTLIWVCLSTLFICLWASLHLNVPAASDSWAKIIRRKFRWMFISLFLPEYVTAVAADQWISARRYAKKLKDIGFGRWTRMHCHYANMGGIFIESEHQHVDAQGLLFLASRGHLPEEPGISEKTIEDKTKADYFLKTIACMQALWFVIQCLGRAAQKLPLSTLELSTVAFVVMAFANYFFWRDKPLDVLMANAIVLVNITGLSYE